MPAIRGQYLNHPSTGEAGFWVELSSSPAGTLTGRAVSAWPSTAGKTIAQYESDLNANIAALVGPRIVVTFTLSSLSPITVSDVTVTEGTSVARKVG